MQCRLSIGCIKVMHPQTIPAVAVNRETDKDRLDAKKNSFCTLQNNIRQ